MHKDGGKLALSKQLPHKCVMGECNKAQPFRTYKVCQEIKLDNPQPEGKAMTPHALVSTFMLCLSKKALCTNHLMQ